ncbi:MAG: hypothetical protein H8D67_11485 [Deltaproteobacteria bacterium]|nr:hypothetical protein [Deltaproteobacteria bacterium]MBL7112630.1 hypothetical protein [Bacteroidales bacterium]
MKIDIDSYLYIVIMIVILIITALGRRKKKPVQQVTGKPAGQPATETGEQDQFDPYEEATVERVVSDPFMRLEQMFAPKETTFIVQEEEPQVTQAKTDADAEARRIKDMEAEKVRKRREDQQVEMAEAFRLHSDGDLTDSSESEERSQISLLTLFDDPEDLKRAIIYSEIINRRDF